MFNRHRKRDVMRHLENEGRNRNRSVSHKRNVYFRVARK
jgi:ribosomal protein S25